MPDNPVERQLRVKYDPELALKICEHVAEGLTVQEICALPDMPSRSGLYKWLTLYPKFFDAYERARELSAQSLEEEALTMARTLKDANDFTGTKVQAYNIAMQQLRWSASRRDKARYGQQVQAIGAVPIQITTTLNLGQIDAPATDNHNSVYTIDVEVPPQPSVVEGYDEDTVDDVRLNGEVLEIDATDGDNATADERPFGVPDHDEQDLHRPKRGRPKKGPRKSPLEAAKTALKYAQMEKKRLAAKEAKEKG